MECTPRQIQVALKYIGLRTHNNFALQASLHGIKIPMKHSSPAAVKHDNFSNEERASADTYMKKRMKQLQNQRFPSKVKRRGR